MKKILSVILILTMILSFSVGCQKKDETSNAANAGTESPATKAETKTIIKLGHVVSEETSLHRAAVAFKDYVEKESQGSLEVQIFPNGQLGGDLQLVEAVSLNTIQMTIPTTAVFTSYDEIFGLLDLPFIFKDANAGFAALDGELGQKLDEKINENGIKNLGYSFNGARSISNNAKPINEPNDVKGLKIRVMESPVFISLFKNLGGNPTPMSFGEVFTALQQGTVDGQENSPALIYAMKFYEAQKYYSLTEHVYSFLVNVINTDFFNSLTDEQQQIVMEGSRKYLIEDQRDDEVNDNIETIEKLKDAGMVINEISAENKKKFQDALVPMHDEYKLKFGQEWFDLINKYNK